MNRTIVEEDYQAIFKQFSALGMAGFDLAGALQPMLFDLKLAGVGQIEKFSIVAPEIITMLFDDRLGSRGKEVMMAFISGMLDPNSDLHKSMPTDPEVDAFVQLNEAWIYLAKDMDDAQMSMKGSLEHRPGRQEVVLVTIHTRSYTRVGYCMINPETRKCAPGDLLPPEVEMTGRLVQQTL